MKALLALMLFFCSYSFSCDSVFLKLGAGYKMSEVDYIDIQINSGEATSVDLYTGKNPTARIELSCETKRFSFGISHDSHWVDGWPFNQNKEMHKTELFVDYKIRLFKK